MNTDNGRSSTSRPAFKTVKLLRKGASPESSTSQQEYQRRLEWIRIALIKFTSTSVALGCTEAGQMAMREARWGLPHPITFHASTWGPPAFIMQISHADMLLPGKCG